jgi:hypothetical protein
MKITLMEKARSMLNGVGLAQEFWAEAVDTAKYLLNMAPSSTLFETTPYVVCSAKKPLFHISKYLDVVHFCIFPRKRGAIWTRRKSNVFSLDTKKE